MALLGADWQWGVQETFDWAKLLKGQGLQQSFGPVENSGRAGRAFAGPEIAGIPLIFKEL